jgi:hypothetical protein
MRNLKRVGAFKRMGSFDRSHGLDVTPSAHVHPVGGPLWQLYQTGRRAECQIVRTAFGFEAQCLFNGRLLASYQFTGLEEALAWAERRCSEMETRGWSKRVA